MSASLQKIERLKSTLHLIGVDAGNTHTLFVEDADDLENFDAAAHFDTHEDVLQRAANRPRMRTMLGEVCSGVSKKTVDEVCCRVALRSLMNAPDRFFLGQQEARCIVRDCGARNGAPSLLCITVPPADTGS
jgi:hypothetical protein